MWERGWVRNGIEIVHVVDDKGAVAGGLERGVNHRREYGESSVLVGERKVTTSRRNAEKVC